MAVYAGFWLVGICPSFLNGLGVSCADAGFFLCEWEIEKSGRLGAVNTAFCPLWWWLFSIRKKLSNMQLGVVIEFDLMLAWH